MSKPQDRTVFPRDDGSWACKSNDASFMNVHQTQKEAIESARAALVAAGGGELTVMGRDGRIRSKDTIAPGHDPRSPRDREH
jgi:hypothetical protein